MEFLKDAGVKSLGYTGSPVAVIKANLGEIKRAFRQRSPGSDWQFHKTFPRKNFTMDTRFHKVIKGFMIQNGGPNSKDDNWLD